MESFLEEGVGLEAVLWLLAWESVHLGSTQTLTRAVTVSSWSLCVPSSQIRVWYIVGTQ